MTDPPRVSELSEFEGKTGIYAVYTTTRIKSLLKRLNSDDVQIKVIPNKESRDILIKITELPKTLTSAYNDVTLSYICDFIYELCSLYNKFYTNYNISNETDPIIKESYIAISKLTYNILSNLLDILAIDQVEKM